MAWPLKGWLDKAFRTQIELPGPRYWEGSGPPYCLTDIAKELRQAEIISDLRYYSIIENGQDATKLDVEAVPVPYSILLTPDCDLLQDFKKAGVGSQKLLGVLIFPMQDFANAKHGRKGPEWRQIAGNQVSQFYSITGITSECDTLGKGLPELLVDFKKYFTLPPAEIYRQCQSSGPTKAYRRCRLNDMWREDFRHRAMSYIGRIGVPDPSDNQ